MTKQVTGKSSSPTGLEIAVIGMAGYFPGAENVNALWRNLLEGKDSVEFLSEEQLLKAGVSKEMVHHPDFVNARRVIPGRENFDASFFGYLPQEARAMDPQIRLFHQCTWNALEDAGYNPHAYKGSIGLYAGGIANPAWSINSFLPSANEDIDPFSSGQLQNRDFLTTLVSHKLNLKGPAVFVQTACSTSLTAIHMACRALLTGESQIAVAGGVALSSMPSEGYLYKPGMVMSPDGLCRAFDAGANGTSGGEGAALVVLKKLKRAVADRDHIYAVIKASAINNDGLRKVGFSAPSVDGQADVIRLTHKLARVEPHTIGYIEAHGTGTILGDPIEIEALTQAFTAPGISPDRSHAVRRIAVGSIKTNIGHLDAAAGAAGLIKAVLILKYGKIPPSLHFKTANPKIDFANSPFNVNSELKEWPNEENPRRAGVSSFGIGGTNAHVLLEEAPQQEKTSKSIGPRLLLLSARTPATLEQQTENMARFFKDHVGGNLLDAAYTLQVGRKHFNYRRMLVCSSMAEAAERLSEKSLINAPVTAGGENIIFMFPGQGAQYPEMGMDLYRSEPYFKQQLDLCFQAAGWPLLEKTSAWPVLDKTEAVQPALFCIEYALGKLLMLWGIKPSLMMGHSSGEFTAAALAGLLTMEEALKLVTARGRLMQQMEGGGMISIPLPEKEIKSFLNDDIQLAAVNSSQLCTLSGSYQAISSLESQCKAEGIRYTRLHTSHAFHSAMMEPMLETFRQHVQEAIPFMKEPHLPYISNLTGKPVTFAQVTDPQYWVDHVRHPVRFEQGLRHQLAEKECIFLEVGPGRVLSTFLEQHRHKKNRHYIINILRHPKEKTSDIFFMERQLGNLWLRGVHIDWPARYHSRNETPCRVPLPTYPFEPVPYPVQIDFTQVMSQLMSHYTGNGNQTSTAVRTSEEPIRRDSQKTARRVFRLPDRPDVTTVYSAPRTSTEKTLAAIWSRFFSAQRIGIDDDFFQLGGDSLKVMALGSRIHVQWGVQPEVRDFFAYPTIRSLAPFIDASAKKSFSPISAVEEKEFYPLSSAQKRLFFYQQMNPGSMDYNLTFSAVGSYDRNLAAAVLERLIKRHESLRTSFHIVEGEPVQRVHGPSREYPGVLRMAKTFSPAHFDMEVAPLFRVTLCKHQARDVMIIEMHHIISDGTSLSVLADEFSQLYTDVNRLLPHPPVRYRDYVLWRQDLYAGGEILKQKTFWLEQFKDQFSLVEVATDFPRPGSQQRTFRGGEIIYHVQGGMLQRLDHVIAAEKVTLFIVLLAIYNILLSRYSGKTDIIVGTGSAGRKHIGLETIIGLFIQVLPIRNRMNRQNSCRDYLQEVKNNSLAAYENEGYPFEELVKALDIQGKSRKNPLFDVAFELMAVDDAALVNQQPQPLVADLPVYAHYDLTIYATRSTHLLTLKLVYAAELFKESTAQKIMEHYIEILERVLSNPEIIIDDITLSNQFNEINTNVLQTDDGEFNF